MLKAEIKKREGSRDGEGRQNEKMCNKDGRGHEKNTKKFTKKIHKPEALI